MRHTSYFETYDRFDEIIKHMERLENLFLVGRNGMHRYNNQDHSMLTAMEAVDNILTGVRSKQNLWEINTEQEYYESRSASSKEPANLPSPDTLQQQDEQKREFIA